MAKLGQSSFRRILLARLLLLSIPVLLTGEVVAYRKARSGLLETARNNLTVSAVRKGESVRDALTALQTNLATATTASALQSKQSAKIKGFLEQLQQSSAIEVQCVQLTNVQTRQIVASTCGQAAIAQTSKNSWSKQQRGVLIKPASVQVSLAQRSKSATQADDQLRLVLSAPVYVPQTSENPVSQLRYVLSLQSALHQTDRDSSKMTFGYTVIIDEDGTILAHPNPDRVGQTIDQDRNSDRWQTLVRNAIAGKQESYLFPFEENGVDWLAGYSSVQISSNGISRTWVILATTPLATALSSLNEIQQVLLILTVGLLTAILLATLYIARDLARPIEQLSDYALRIRERYSSDRAPKDFKVRELNHLAEALDNMVERLEERAEELETAWQEAQIANQLKSEFLATTSHELRTPLNAIIGSVRLVRDGCCDDRAEELEFLQQADDAALHLLKIINDLLDIAKIEAGKVELSLQPVPIQDLCRQCLKMVEPGSEMKRLKLVLELDDRVDRALIDERRVRQMVINLLSNAVKFTPEGGQVTLKAWLAHGHQLEQDTRPDHSPINPHTPYLCLEVQDSGIGIPEDRWHLLFRPFQQIDSSLTRKHEGTGLGLALTKRLAELHGGTLSFDSVQNSGSTFRIWLPLLEPMPVNAAKVTIDPAESIDPSTPQLSETLPLSVPQS
ncbi:HAMP domain-containing protein [Phormidesmis priestleyi ULC007]|uniref:Circadian input-output histidine kinase CikA n=1 Tax=Phormidesmis priestleyi ULC007 TaxID=1920490 RepID=A0A2T1DIH7_9CYAN|nr:sensor histidine kinase [Phormidesmis priestleyi]PSB20287.1 HAMP domain-containing protein [Phormidesmis priestleyi ULC007]PZO50156.1 MAG: HAMP domain-containing protein [Phormidesmis priestleyi]